MLESVKAAKAWILEPSVNEKRVRLFIFSMFCPIDSFGSKRFNQLVDWVVLGELGNQNSRRSGIHWIEGQQPHRLDKGEDGHCTKMERMRHTFLQPERLL